MQQLGRLLQIAGLTLLPLGVVLEATGQLGRHGVADLLLILLFGATAFWLGRVLEGYAGSSD